jgi:hypothetical protein
VIAEIFCDSLTLLSSSRATWLFSMKVCRIESVTLDEPDTLALDLLDKANMLIVRISDLHAFADIHRLPPQFAG